MCEFFLLFLIKVPKETVDAYLDLNPVMKDAWIKMDIKLLKRNRNIFLTNHFSEHANRMPLNFNVMS